MKKILVNIKGEKYFIFLGPEIIQALSDVIGDFKSVSSISVISNATVDKLYGKTVKAELALTGIPVHSLFVRDGEKYKNVSEAEKLLNQLLATGVDRDGLVISLGGGVLGDLSGFVAATYQRGIRFGQIPTTLLSAVDASVGGKVAVNLSKGKNMMGAFYQPVFVLADVSFLRSLKERDYLSGVAEVIKHGLIGDKKLLQYMITHLDMVKKRHKKTVEFMIERSVKFKLKVVSKDEKEKGLRAILNFGHTIGHAIESLLEYKGVTHGEAVSCGMITALFLSKRVLNFPQEEIENAICLIKEIGLPLWIKGVSIDGIIEHIKYDKKRKKSATLFVLLKDLAKPEFGVSLPLELVKETLKEQQKQFA